MLKGKELDMSIAKSLVKLAFEVNQPAFSAKEYSVAAIMCLPVRFHSGLGQNAQVPSPNGQL